MNIQKVLKTVFILIILPGTLTGCWNLRELKDISIVMGVGYDIGKNSEPFALSFEVVKPDAIKGSKEHQQSGGSKAFSIVKSSGNSVFGAVRSATHESSRKLYFPHNQMLVIGKEAAVSGVYDFFDFYIRDHETRPTVSVVVIDGKAEDIWNIDTQQDNLPSQTVENLLYAQKSNSQTPIINVQDFIIRLRSKTAAPIAPWSEINSIDGKQVLYVSGTAVFKKDKLAGKLDEVETRGLLWTLGEVESGIVEIQCPEHNDSIGLEIIRSEGKIRTAIQGKKVYADITINTTQFIGNMQCPYNTLLIENIKKLEKLSEAAIKNEVLSAVRKAKALNADIFGFGDAVYKKYPREWKTIEKDWDELFMEIEVALDVECKIERAGTVNQNIEER